MTGVRIKNVARINAKALPEDTNPDFEFRYVDIGAIDRTGTVHLPDEQVRFENAPSRARRLAPAGSVVVSTVRTYLRAIATVPATNDALIFSTGFAVLEAEADVDSRFLGYHCQSQPFIDDVVSRSVGVSYPAINASEIGNLPIALPSLAEQRRIADFLDAEISRIDKLTSFRDRQVASLEEHTYGDISEALTPGILSRPLNEGPWRWLPKLPDARPIVRLGYVCRLQNGLTVDGKRKTDEAAVTRPYLRVANVQAGSLDLDEVTDITVPRDVAEGCALVPGDVLMTEGGDLDKLGRGTVWRDEIPGCLHQNHVFALRPEPHELDGEYLAYLTRTLHGRCYFECTGVKTTNLASTNTRKIMSFPVPLPEIEEQHALVREVQAAIDVMARAKRALHRQLDLLAERRQALITAAVTGEFDVSTASGRGTGV